MDTNIDALKNLYVALGGNIEDVEGVNTTPDMINAIATVAAGISGGANIPDDRLLPVVKSADNNKVLTVVSGKWKAAELPA